MAQPITAAEGSIRRLLAAGCGLAATVLEIAVPLVAGQATPRFRNADPPRRVDGKVEPLARPVGPGEWAGAAREGHAEGNFGLTRDYHTSGKPPTADREL